MPNLTRRRFVTLASLTAMATTTPLLARDTELHRQKESHLPLVGEEPVFTSPAEGLNLLLTVQYAELALYTAAIDLELDDATANLVAGLVEIEAGHVEALVETIIALDSSPVESPEFAFEISDSSEFLAVASVLESASASCVQGLTGTLITNDTALNAALRTHESDARHLAVIEGQRGNVPFPLAIHPTLPPATINEILSQLTV